MLYIIADTEVSDYTVAHVDRVLHQMERESYDKCLQCSF